MFAYFKTYLAIFFIFIASFLFSYFFPGKGLRSDFSILLTISSFIFGFYIALAVSRTKEKQDSVRRQLRLADGLFVSCSIEMKVFPEKVQQEFLKKVDNYLVASIDYKLVDLDKSSDEFYDLYDYATNHVEPKNDAQSNAISRVCASLYEMSKERAFLEVSAKNRVTKTEWALIVGLLIVILYLIFNLGITGILGTLFVSIMVSSLATILLILYQYNNLSWQEDIWFWGPLTRTFLQLGLKPYYGDFLIKQKRYKLPKDIEYRLAHYPSPYPNFDDKVVEIIKPKSNSNR